MPCFLIIYSGPILGVSPGIDAPDLSLDESVLVA
jgi:hypothetical protein